MNKKKKKVILFTVIGVVLLGFATVLGGLGLWLIFKDKGGDDTGTVAGGEFEMTRFEDEGEFSEYLENIDNMYGMGAESGMGSVGRPSTAQPSFSPDMDADSKSFTESTGSAQPGRYSQTNVQVEGIDEPDIVKTDGEYIYFSQNPDVYGGEIPEPIPTGDNLEGNVEDIEVNMQEPVNLPTNVTEPNRGVGNSTVKPIETGKVKVIDAFPVEEIEQLAEIDLQGNLLLVNDVLVVTALERIIGYDVEDRENPKKLWEYEFEGRSRLVDARLKGDDLFLVTSTMVDRMEPCPVNVLSGDSAEVKVVCSDIYYPRDVQVAADSVYSILKIDIEKGEVEDQNSFVGGNLGGMTTIYMSPNSIYVSYFHTPDLIEFMAGFVEANSDIFPEYFVEDVKDLAKMDIGQAAKMTELEEMGEKLTASMDEDESYEFENEMEDRMNDYAEDNKRELGKTGIAKFDLDDLSMKATGLVPGMLLNQFAMDEYKQDLRVATTVSGDMLSGISESENDVYILDKDLKVKGSVQGMGLDERIYSVRFMGDKGYVVTFKQIDPFYVLDLSNSDEPSIKGELKIPGYSSYLHPLKDDLILGVGEQNGQVKLSLFDVSDPSDPQEKDKFMMSDYWSEVGSNHRAFLQDSKFEVFFIPSGRGGSIFSYEGEEFELIKSISGYDLRRAVFIDDYFYVIGDSGITVFDENNWEEVSSLEFGQ